MPVAAPVSATQSLPLIGTTPNAETIISNQQQLAARITNLEVQRSSTTTGMASSEASKPKSESRDTKLLVSLSCKDHLGSSNSHTVAATRPCSLSSYDGGYPQRKRLVVGPASSSTCSRRDSSTRSEHRSSFRASRLEELSQRFEHQCGDTGEDDESASRE